MVESKRAGVNACLHGEAPGGRRRSAGGRGGPAGAGPAGGLQAARPMCNPRRSGRRTRPVPHRDAPLPMELRQLRYFLKVADLGSISKAAGRLLYRHAQTITRQVQSAEDDVTTASGSPTGTVSVGLPTTVLHTLGMPLLGAVLARHPGITLHVVDGVSALLQEFALNGRLGSARSGRRPTCASGVASIHAARGRGRGRWARAGRSRR
jgi:hypothetical protein